MWKKLKKQEGYALILVLLIIIIIGIMVPPLISSVLNSAKQNIKVEEEVQLDHISEMGLKYFESLVESKEQDIIADIQNKLESQTGQLEYLDIINIIKNNVNLTLPHTVTLAGNSNYQYTINILEQENYIISDVIEIEYTSNAKILSNGKEKKKVAELIINFVIDEVDNSDGNNDNNDNESDDNTENDKNDGNNGNNESNGNK